jgi:hypothetical protein
MFDVIQLAATTCALPWTSGARSSSDCSASARVPARCRRTHRRRKAQHEQFLALGLEGSVCKRTDSRYFNRRTSAWVKIKPQKTAEAKIVGFKPGKKGTSLEGKCGAFKLEMLPDGAKTTVKCGTDDRHDGRDRPPGELAREGHRDQAPRDRRERRAPPPAVPTASARTAPRRRASGRCARRRTRSPGTPKVTGAGRMRNYGAMLQPKLERCLRELEGRRRATPRPLPERRLGQPAGGHRGRRAGAAREVRGAA